MIRVPKKEQRNEETAQTAAFKVFICGGGASEGTLELIASIYVIHGHSAHHIGRHGNESAASGDGVDESGDKQHGTEPDQIVNVFHSSKIPLVVLFFIICALPS